MYRFLKIFTQSQFFFVLKSTIQSFTLFLKKKSIIQLPNFMDKQFKSRLQDKT